MYLVPTSSLPQGRLSAIASPKEEYNYGDWSVTTIPSLTGSMLRARHKPMCAPNSDERAH
ncbi:hypothetical protein [Scytonema millei]|uniref:Uncharacterized protein n=1 Tax=Scytonema millei VB511283 TaxID=1245923 RepID=A0A9X5I4A4_9CYAN|nr:hypothetical protein [Scytonema millei]NHC35368.1 hypothetical protein [Scytonema millei VB511283]